MRLVDRIGDSQGTLVDGIFRPANTSHQLSRTTKMKYWKYPGRRNLGKGYRYITKYFLFGRGHHLNVKQSPVKGNLDGALER